ncbi:MAG: pilin [Hahellaceae bacterium]|nr:pilin [Hahellaceae bacterium]MCP5168200.1 pilin [Hahellaceae bacterium]
MLPSSPGIPISSPPLGLVTGLLVTLVVAGVGMAVAINASGPAIVKARLTEPFSFAPTLKTEQAIYFAHQGVWPDSVNPFLLWGEAALNEENPATRRQGQVISDVTVTPDGSFHFALHAKEHALDQTRLSFVHTATATEGFVLHRWTCNGGESESPKANLTTVPAHLLPSLCRNQSLRHGDQPVNQGGVHD